ncbi:hypothetical protein HPB47_023504 [Ixodes persulcatus]|uniref:Uncharacterized protein n=1 Tax=Ixodes persulcatus TaxID=34615 RepID=A0AC60Q7W7_IXOPE|nr:hypothetical protein HPB47_023504 [Ixodes persulcatus]
MEVERKRRLAAVALALTIEDEEDLNEPKRAIPQSGELLHERDEVKRCIVAPCRHRRTTKASVVARDTAAGPAEARPDGHRNTQPSIPEDKSNLSAKLHSARCDVIFLQTQHRLTLKGLHAEIAKLQQTVKDSYKARIEELEENLDKWCCHCRYLTSQLEHANKALVALNQRIQVQDWQHQAELKEKNSVIANLQRELEWKCRTLAEMEMSSRRRSFVRQLPGGEASAVRNPDAPEDSSCRQDNVPKSGPRIAAKVPTGHPFAPKFLQSRNRPPSRGATFATSHRYCQGLVLPRKISSKTTAEGALATVESPPTKILAIDQVPSPELKPKKITNRAVEVTTK